ncbi:hypothetical protein NKH47_02115 [Mesorhizobium sp. M1060]|uniref:hypothetical protein n=1 Tax=unclassified Mesorhizobium TaxID=325217 RepID=UPI0003CF46D6|nr:hypothetical protein [Mesorhizobium sp. LSJC264A00]ESX19684.1 hypothetical protein X767_22090 [Mesorhizobium sp. LSJC264A00]
MKHPKVAKVISEYKVVLNVGKNEGVKVGQDYIIYRQGEEIKDPDTGEQLGIFEEVIGRGVITYVQERIATLESSEVLEGGRKVIRKSTGLQGWLTPTTEEVVEMPDKTKPFRKAMVGDLAKRM